MSQGNEVSWAQQWHALGALPFGATYNAALRAITDQVTKQNAMPSRPNGSALLRLRTDENQLANPYELRQFEFTGTASTTDHLLHQVTVTNTADSSLDFTRFFGGWLGTVAAPPNPFESMPLQYTLPNDPPASALRGGASEDLSPNAVWDGFPSQPTDTRNKVSVNSCNGCHHAETMTNNLHAQLDPNPLNPAILSKFLLGNSNTAAMPTTFSMPDPISGVTRQYGDLLRRKTFMEGELSNACGTQIVSPQGLSFTPISAGD